MDYSAIQEIPFEAAIASPLLACNEAQIKLMGETAGQLSTFFEQRERDHRLVPIYEKVCFIGEDGKASQRLRIPRMSLFPIPTMEVEDMTVNFQVRVTKISQNKLTVRMLNEQTESTSSEKLNCYLSIRLHAGMADMPMGLAKFYQLCTDQMTTVTAEVG